MSRYVGENEAPGLSSSRTRVDRKCGYRIPQPRPMKRTLTPEENTLFDERIRYWQDRLGLNDWRIERGRRKTTAMASVKVSYGDRMAAYVTGDFGSADVAKSIDSTALHEVLHVLLAEVIHVNHATTDEELRASAEHRVVTTLEKLLAP